METTRYKVGDVLPSGKIVEEVDGDGRPLVVRKPTPAVQAPQEAPKAPEPVADGPDALTKAKAPPKAPRKPKVTPEAPKEETIAEPKADPLDETFPRVDPVVEAIADSIDVKGAFASLVENAAKPIKTKRTKVKAPVINESAVAEKLAAITPQTEEQTQEPKEETAMKTDSKRAKKTPKVVKTPKAPKVAKAPRKAKARKAAKPDKKGGGVPFNAPTGTKAYPSLRNLDKAVPKGRIHGTGHRLSDEEKVEARKLRSKDPQNYTLRRLASIYGVDPGSMWYILNGGRDAKEGKAKVRKVKATKTTARRSAVPARKARKK